MPKNGPRHSSDLSRRALLETLGLGAVAIGAGACKPAEPAPGPERNVTPSVPWDGDPNINTTLFRLGIQSGDPKPNSLLLWTHYAGDYPLELTIVHYVDGTWTPEAPFTVTTSESGYVHHLVSLPSPDTPIAFQFKDTEGAASEVGYSRSAIDRDSSGIIRFGATSCTSKTHVDFPSMENLAKRYEMDFFMWLGDIVYADDAKTLEEYRSFYEYNLQTNGFKAIMGSTPGIFSWDDHEVANNWSRNKIDPVRLEAATTAYFENLAIAPDASSPSRLWRSFRFGQTVEVFVLDCRSERDPSLGHYLSPEQLEWLKQSLLQSNAVWKVIHNSVPITKMPPIYQVPEMFEDRWEGFPTQREELLNTITDNGLTGVLFVSGDLHQSSLSRVEVEGPRRSIFEVCAGPSGPNFLGTPARYFEDGDQWPWADAENCATWFACHSSGICRIVTVDEYDNTLFDGIIDIDGNLLSSDIFHTWE